MKVKMSWLSRNATRKLSGSDTIYVYMRSLLKLILSCWAYKYSGCQHVWECFLEFCFLQRNLWCLGVARCPAILFLPRQMTTWKVALCFSHITSYVPVHVKRLMPTPAGVIYLPLHLSRPPSTSNGPAWQLRRCICCWKSPLGLMVESLIKFWNWWTANYGCLRLKEHLQWNENVV